MPQIAESNRIYPAKNWCVTQNLKNFKITLNSGGNKYFDGTKRKIIFESDDLKEAEKFMKNYNDEDDEQLIGYTCDICGNFQPDPSQCEACGAEFMSPIWD